MKKNPRRQARTEATTAATAAIHAGPSRPSQRLAVAACAILVAVVVVVVHWPVLNAKAICIDDQEYLVANRLVQSPSWASAERFLSEVRNPSTVGGYYQPLPMISLMLDYAQAGRVDNLRPFHRTSLILHVANTLMILWLLYALFGRPWIAAGVALLFGLHPMTVETVAWVGERKTLLAAFFAFGCLLAYVGYARKGKWTLYVGCLVLYVLALMSKPTSTPLPLAMLLLDFWPLRRLTGRAVLEKLPLIAVAGGFAVITVISQRHLALSELNAFSTGQTLLLMCHDLVVYPVHMIWPVRLTSLYPFPENISLTNGYLLAGVIAAVAMLVLAILSLRWTRAILTGCLLYGLLLLPTMLNLGYSPAIAWDKYAYLPALGILLMLGALLNRLVGSWAGGGAGWRPAAMGVAVFVAAGCFAQGTRQYLWEWQTSERHSLYMLDLAPDSQYALNHCGSVFEAQGQYARAAEYYTRAIARVPWYAFAYNNRGNCYTSLRQFDQALSDFGMVIKLKPDYAPGYYNRANALSDMGRFEEAVPDYSRAIELKSGYADAYHNRAIAFLYLKQYDRAWADVDMYRRLGGRPNAGLIEALTAATGRSQ